METHYLDRQAAFDRVWSYYIVQGNLPGSIDSTCLMKVITDGLVLKAPLAVLDQSASLFQARVALASGHDLDVVYDRHQDEFKKALTPYMRHLDEAVPEADMLDDGDREFLKALGERHESALDYVRTGLSPVIDGRVVRLPDGKFDSSIAHPDCGILREEVIARLSEELIELASDFRLRYR